jgi:hypothetical protein
VAGNYCFNRLDDTTWTGPRRNANLALCRARPLRTDYVLPERLTRSVMLMDHDRLCCGSLIGSGSASRAGQRAYSQMGIASTDTDVWKVGGVEQKLRSDDGWRPRPIRFCLASGLEARQKACLANPDAWGEERWS